MTVLALKPALKGELSTTAEREIHTIRQQPSRSL